MRIFLYLYYNKGHKIKFHTGVSVIFSAFHRSRLHVTQNPWWLELTSLTGGERDHLRPLSTNLNLKGCIARYRELSGDLGAGILHASIAPGHGLSRGSMSVPRANMEDLNAHWITRHTFSTVLYLVSFSVSFRLLYRIRRSTPLTYWDGSPQRMFVFFYLQ